jgi:hypothetical protein
LLFGLSLPTAEPLASSSILFELSSINKTLAFVPVETNKGTWLKASGVTLRAIAGDIILNGKAKESAVAQMVSFFEMESEREFMGLS